MKHSGIIATLSLATILVGCQQTITPLPPEPQGNMPEEITQSPKPPCDGKAAFDEPNKKERVTVTEFTKIISIEIDTNDQWAMTAPPDVAMPYASTINGIEYGKPYWTDTVHLEPTCDLQREFSLELKPWRNLTDTTAFYTTEYPGATVETVSVGSHKAVVLSNIQAMCPTPTLEIIGLHDNVILRPACNTLGQSSVESLIQQLKNTANTVRFL